MSVFFRRLGGGVVCFVVAGVGAAQGAVPSNFAEAGQTVNGFQDTFDSGTFDPGWTAILGGTNNNGTAGQSTFTLPGDGTLHMNGANGDPNKLLYAPSGVTYADGSSSALSQNILAMVRETANSTDGGDGFRGGVAGASSSANGKGQNLLFRPTGQNQGGADPATNHFNLLYDAVAWGPVIKTVSATPAQLNFVEGTDYWLREVVQPNAATGTNNLANDANDVFAKIWPADGVTPEPTDFNAAFDEGATGTSGLAGLATNSAGGAATFQVDYVLIQASGLSSITAVPEPTSLALLGVGASALLLRRRRLQA